MRKTKPVYSVTLVDFYKTWRYWQKTDSINEPFLTYVRKEIRIILNSTAKICVVGRSGQYAYYSRDFGYDLKAYPMTKKYWPDL